MSGSFGVIPRFHPPKQSCKKMPPLPNLMRCTLYYSSCRSTKFEDETLHVRAYMLLIFVFWPLNCDSTPVVQLTPQHWKNRRFPCYPLWSLFLVASRRENVRASCLLRAGLRQSCPYTDRIDNFIGRGGNFGGSRCS